ncbi:hypothetical protein ACQWHJ_25415, partial [Salmonella enterica subsp. enterica serovar Infantis]
GARSCLWEWGMTTGFRLVAGSRSGRNKSQPLTVTVSRNIKSVPGIQPYTTFLPESRAGNDASAAPRVYGMRQPARGFNAG